MRTHARLPLALGVLAALVLAACGINESAEPEVLAEENLPCVLRPDCSTSTTDRGSTERPRATVYFVEPVGDQTALAPVARDAAADTGVAAAVELLFSEPPTEAERNLGLTTFIPEQATVREVNDLGDGVIEIDLSEGFGRVTGTGQRIAYAQLVYTATELDGVDAVLFAIEGERQSAITADGTPKADPVRRRDYREFQPDA